MEGFGSLDCGLTEELFWSDVEKSSKVWKFVGWEKFSSVADMGDHGLIAVQKNCYWEVFNALEIKQSLKPRAEVGEEFSVLSWGWHSVRRPL